MNEKEKKKSHIDFISVRVENLKILFIWIE